MAIMTKQTINRINRIKSFKFQDYQVDFSTARENTIASVLGFEKRVYSDARQESQNVVNILSVNSIQVKTDLIKESFGGGKGDPIIFISFSQMFRQDTKLSKHRKLRCTHLSFWRASVEWRPWLRIKLEYR